ncbi:hypothetical protein HKCCSP123_09145 [Rhodobacterales bacterium HKCCSP123]|nr:hypothetical protein [Rhodobacterales bacterium HKCCSP123]
MLAGLLPVGTGAQAQPDFEGLECLSAPFDSPRTPDGQRIAALVDWLRSRLAPYPPLSELLEVDPPELCLAERIFAAQAYYEPNEHRIVFRETLSPAFMGAVAIHELRHVHQSRLGACPHPDLSMEATASVTLAMEADASAVSLAIAWQLRAQGEPETWDALAAWPSYAPLVQAFETELRARGDIALATGAAFAAWYEIEWLAESYYVAACSAYLDRQDETHALPRYGSIEPDFRETLCRLPDGSAYPCDAQAARPERR